MRPTIDVEEFERVHAEAVLIIRNAEAMLVRAEALVEKMLAANAARLGPSANSAEPAARPN